MKFAVLGLGSIGLRHARNLMSLGCEVIGFDPDPARRRLLEEAGGRATAARVAALDGANAAVIASPSAQHLDDLRVVVGAGLHAFVEKPLAHTTEGLAVVLDEAAMKRRLVFAGLMLRWHPCVERAREALAANVIGRVLWARAFYGSYLPGWRPHQDYRFGYAADPRSGGVLFDLVHEFDLLHHLLGASRVLAAAARRSGELDMESEDIADVVMRHESGVQSTLHVDYLTRPPMRTVEIGGTDGSLKLDLNSRRYRRSNAKGEATEDEHMPGSYAEDYISEMRDFVAAIVGRCAPRCDGVEAARVLRQVIEARQLCGLPQ